MRRQSRSNRGMRSSLEWCLSPTPSRVFHRLWWSAWTPSVHMRRQQNKNRAWKKTKLAHWKHNALWEAIKGSICKTIYIYLKAKKKINWNEKMIELKIQKQQNRDQLCTVLATKRSQHLYHRYSCFLGLGIWDFPNMRLFQTFSLHMHGMHVKPIPRIHLCVTMLDIKADIHSIQSQRELPERLVRICIQI